MGRSERQVCRSSSRAVTAIRTGVSGVRSSWERTARNSSFARVASASRRRRPLLLVDVGAGAEPLDDAARGIRRGQAPDQEPAIGPIRTAVATLDLVGRPGADRIVPCVDDALPILRVDVLGPDSAETPLRREAGHLVPSPVEVGGPAIGPRGPDQLGQGLGQQTEPPLAAAEGRLIASRPRSGRRTGSRSRSSFPATDRWPADRAAGPR